MSSRLATPTPLCCTTSRLLSQPLSQWTCAPLLQALEAALAQLNSPDRRKIDNALSDAKDELQKPKPDKNEVGKAVERALDYAKKAEGFAKAAQTLTPHITNAVGWLGQNWHTLLQVVGLTG
jgi:hypothetical protein